MNNPQFVITADGSKTLYHPGVGEHYHSKHGAWQESQHVFLGQGLQHYLAQHPEQGLVRVLEVGFGTGLNFLSTADFARDSGPALEYVGVEAYPLSLDTIRNMGYEQYIAPALWDSYLQGYEAALSAPIAIESDIQLQIAHQKILELKTTTAFDVVYFDAFAAVHQPDMWSDEVLAHVAGLMNPGAVFVTYAITGDLKRSMKALGFTIEKAPGAPGKREMLRATKA